MKTLLTRSLAAVALAAAAMAFTACEPQAAVPDSAPAPVVTVAPVESRDLIEHEEVTARLDAVESVEVRPRVSGHLQKVHFQAGQLVRRDEVLFTIDPRWHQAALDKAAAEVQRARAEAVKAGREAERARSLLATRAISNEEADERESRAAVTQAELVAAEAVREAARLDLEFTAVRAPIDGRVSRALVTAGNHVSGVPGFTTLLTTIVSVDPIHAYSDLDEAAFLRLGDLVRDHKLAGPDGRIAVEMALGDSGEFAYRGFVESLDNRLDPATGSLLVRTVFGNPDGRLVPGLFARVRLPGSERRPALLVSERAIGTDQNQRFVFTLTPTNTVEYRRVEVGPVIEGKRVIRSGLHAGERVVVNGLQRIRPGQAVSPGEEMAAAQPASLAAAQ